MKYYSAVFFLCTCGLISCCSNKHDDAKHKNFVSKPCGTMTTQNDEPQFHRDGSLSFFSHDGKLLSTIDYELAATPEKRSQGLMFRKSMQESHGMLFVYEDFAPRFFYMKNTYIPLDIIFMDDEKQIFKIYSNAHPSSEELLPSGQNAHYAIEVNAGFCEKFGIVEGVSIRF